MFLVNSCLGLFTATLFRGRPFSRSYGTNLPSSLTTLLPLALGFSPHLPVSVCGTGTSLRLFSPQSIIDFPTISSVPFARRDQRPGSTISMCQLSRVRWLRNFYRMCIDYASRPRLSSRLTLGGRTFPRKPWAFDAHVSRMGLATHTGILSSVKSTSAPALASILTQCSSTDAYASRCFGVAF